MSPSSDVALPLNQEKPALAERLLQEMSAAWQRGERPPSESYFERHPELLADAEQAVRLVYEEVCLRQDRGEEVDADELLRRFPQWAQELAVLLDCHRLMQAHLAPPLFPPVGETIGDFRLTALLGRGTEGHVYLATQPALADRPVVLKVVPRRAREHLALARLQHTHIIPLHGAYDFPQRNLRALCMPFVGGATLAQILELLRGTPAARRTGQSLAHALDTVERSAPIRLPGEGHRRRAFASASYVETICWIGICLADALQHAHERGFVHLDLKPANLLLATDGQPLLLDFHLAREPIKPGTEVPQWLGGTPAYMSAEQQAALEAIQQGRPVQHAVDCRSDIYSLGVLLYEALAGNLPSSCGKQPLSTTLRLSPGAGNRTHVQRNAPDLEVCTPLRPLHRVNGCVSVGLADLVAKCLAQRPEDRYGDAAALAADLRRHLADLPLRGVANRSWLERWTKWRRRRPNALLWTGLLLALCAGGLALAAGIVGSHAGQDIVQVTEKKITSREAAPPPSSNQRAAEHVERGRSFMDLGKLEKAAAEFERAVDVCTQDFSANLYRGMCAYQRKQYADAVQSFSIAIALAPGSAECYHDRALAYAAWGKNDHALHDYDRALALAPNLAAAALNRGILHYQEGRHAQARADLERALRAGADPGDTHFNLALVTLALHDEPAARQHLRSALSHNPQHPKALQLERQLGPAH